MTSTQDNRFRVIDCMISRMDMQRAIETVTTRVRSGVGGYVCFSNVHTVVMAHSDPRLREITNDSFLSMPDGKPIAVLARLKGIGGVKRVAGPDFLPRFVCKASGLRHFFYGSSHQALENLVVRLRQDYPKIKIAGWYSPPFREMTALENDEAIKLINAARPDVVWVGLGAPKQEYWMAEHWRSLQPAVVLGVGAAFDFHAGLLARAPTWIQAVGLEWLHRFCQEPTRLWRRYLFTNSLFMFYLLRDALRH